MNARIPSIDASPEACAARAQRIEGYTVASRVRADSLAAAQAVYSKFRLHNGEVLRAIQNLEASIDLPQDDWIKERLSELCCDIENDMRQPEPEVLGWDKRGEFDGYTQRSVR